jgi:hypothetical protein
VKLAGLASVAALAAVSSVALAQPAAPLPPAPPASAATPVPKGKPAAVPLAKKKPPVPGRPTARPGPKEPETHDPAPDVRLTLEATGPRGGWTMRVTNAGQVPVRLVADARLLSLEVTPRGERKPVHCELPPEMRPADDSARALVLPPERSYVEPLEPVLYCFGGRQLAALAQGAIVVGHLGWTDHAGRAPFVVAPIDGIDPVVAALKKLDSPPIGLPDAPTLTEWPAAQASPDNPDRPKLTLRGQEAAEAPSPSRVWVTVTLRNEGKRPVTLRFRPESLRFDVSGPGGRDRCKWPTQPVAAMRNLFTTIQPGGSESTTVGLDAYCPGHLFDQPGLLVVRPELDTRKASGADIALATFDGRVVSPSLTYVRLHEGGKPVPLGRPKLEPLPQPPAPAPGPTPPEPSASPAPPPP